MNYFFNSLAKKIGLTLMVITISIAGFGQVLPGFQLVQKKETAVTAAYTFKKGNKRMRLQLKRAGNKVNARIINLQTNNIMGKMVITPKGNYGRNIDVLSTKDGLFFLWVFGLDRTQNNGGSMKLLSLNSQLSPDLLACIEECEDAGQIVELAKEDQKGKIVVKAGNLSSLGNTSGCTEIIVCTEDALSDYDKCVEKCYETYVATNK